MTGKFYALSTGMITALIFMGMATVAQNSVGIGTLTPDQSAVLDVTSSNKGVLIPRMTKAERNAITSPAAGLLVYQSDDSPGFYYYQGGWQSLSGSPSSANRSLSNLVAPIAVNTDLLPAATATHSLGSSSSGWKDIYFYGDLYLQSNRFISMRGTNSFFGSLAGTSLITGLYNTATGNSALANITSGTWNTAVGYQSMFNNGDGLSNTGVGFQSLYVNTSGKLNTATGVLALGNNITGNENSALGATALSLSTGNYNTAIGSSAGQTLTGGNQNTFLGAFTSASGSPSNSTAIGYEAQVSSSNSVRVGNSSVSSIGGFAGWTTFPSDGRFKKNVRENVPGLAFINQLRPVTYNVDVNALASRFTTAASDETNLPDAAKRPRQIFPGEMDAKQQKASFTYTGFIAQEVEAAAKELGFEFSGVDVPKNDKDLYGIRYAEFVVPLVKAVQELNQKVESLVRENNALKKSNAEQDNVQKIVRDQQAQIDSQQKEIDGLKAFMQEIQKQVNASKQHETK